MEGSLNKLLKAWTEICLLGFVKSGTAEPHDDVGQDLWRGLPMRPGSPVFHLAPSFAFLGVEEQARVLSH